SAHAAPARRPRHRRGLARSGDPAPSGLRGRGERGGSGGPGRVDPRPRLCDRSRAAAGPRATVSSTKHWALSVPLDGFTLAEHGEIAREAERLGYTDAWSYEIDGVDCFAPLAVVGVATSMRLGTAIVNVYTRGPPTLAVSAAGEVADGAVLNWLSADDVPKSVAVVREAAARAGRDPASVEITARLLINVDPPSPTADLAVRRHVTAYLNVPVYRAFHEWLG